MNCDVVMISGEGEEVRPGEAVKVVLKCKSFTVNTDIERYAREMISKCEYLVPSNYDAILGLLVKLRDRLLSTAAAESDGLAKVASPEDLVEADHEHRIEASYSFEAEKHVAEQTPSLTEQNGAHSGDIQGLAFESQYGQEDSDGEVAEIASSREPSLPPSNAPSFPASEDESQDAETKSDAKNDSGDMQQSSVAAADESSDEEV